MTPNRAALAQIKSLAHGVTRLLLAFGCHALLVSSVAIAVYSQQYFKNWTTEDGLPQNNVINIAQTPDGYLWVATVDGLARFDGVRFKIFNKANTPEMPNNRIWAMFTDTAGRLWFSYQNEQTVVVYENGKFKAFEKGRDFNKDEDGAASSRYNNELTRNLLRNPEMRFRAGSTEYIYENGSFAERPAGDYVFPSKVFATDDKSVWIDDGETLCNIKDGQLTRYPKNAPLPFDTKDVFPVDSAERDGVLWFSPVTTLRPDDRLHSFNDGKLKIFPLGPGIEGLEFDAKGNLWLPYKGMTRIDAATIARNDPSNFPVKTESINGRRLFRDRDNNLWFGGVGLFLINTEPAVTVYSRSTGLPADNVYPIVQDREGTIWFAAWQDKLISYSNDKFSSENALTLTSLFVDSRARLWKGVGPYIHYRENGQWVPVDFVKTLPPPWRDDDFSNVQLAFIAEDTKGNMWFGTQAGVVRYTSEGSQIFTVADGLPSNVVTSYLLTKGGEMWIGTNSGVARLENGRFRAFTEADGLAGNFTRSITEDADGTVWIGGYDGGLTRCKKGEFAKITKRNGLFSDGVFVILEDDDGWFWMNSNQGIYRVRKQELNDFADGKIESVTSISYGPEDGLLETEGNGGSHPTGLKAADGKLWFPMAKGVAVIDPKTARRDSVPPSVLIEDVRIDQKPLDILDNLRLGPDQVALEIDYTALGFVGAERTRFRYRLEGLEDIWTEAGSRRTAYFSHLPAGEYVFRVAAANPDGVWNNDGATLRVTIVPPFYRTSWFSGVAAMGVLALILLVYFYRVRQLERRSETQLGFARRLIESQEGERRRIALELHDSLGQTLAVIRNQTLLGLDTKDPAKTTERLREISEASAIALRETREIAHNLHPAQIDNLGLTTALRSLVQSVESATGMKCVADIGEVPDNLPYDAAISIYRITQESLSNIIKHSGASFAAVSLRVDGGTLVLTIEDDGRGFVESQAVKGLGLTGMRERAKMIDADLTINSQPEHGTTTKLVLPLK